VHHTAHGGDGGAPERPCVPPPAGAPVGDGVFEEVACEGGADAHAQARAQAHSPGVIFHPATGVDADAVAQVQASLRRRILRALGHMEARLTKVDALQVRVYNV
jgi:hypothetical protein